MSRILTTMPSQSAPLVTNLYGQVTTVFGNYGVVGQGICTGLAKSGSILIQPYRRSNTDFRQSQLTTQDPMNFHPVMTDFTKPAQIRAVVEPADHVVVSIGRHMPSNSILRWRDLKWGYDAVHRMLPVEIAKHCKETGKETMVFISRIGAHVDSESQILRALGRAEVEIREIMPEAIIIRPSDVFSLQGSMYVDLFRNTARRMYWRSLPIYPEMLARRSQPVFNADIGIAVATALRDPTMWGKTFELGGRQVLSFGEITEFVARQCKSSVEYINMPYPVAKLYGQIRSAVTWDCGFPKDYFVRMQYNSIANEFHDKDIYGWEDLGIDQRQLILLEEIAPDALYNWAHFAVGTTTSMGGNMNDMRFMH
eukprot:TRINITY_DN15092_c0_g1_i2.p1 TRINITY_DN15092_c0_g1~~TRINITY_DN15092_c0_g1_i2.p1  ORF type:complete len:367 (+),score=101.12 TRINITY_DN15092_c0_g1_i2:126-1226(+)